MEPTAEAAQAVLVCRGLILSGNRVEDLVGSWGFEVRCRIGRVGDLLAPVNSGRRDRETAP